MSSSNVQYLATNRDGDQSMTVFGTDWQKPVAGTHPNFGRLMTYFGTTPQDEWDEAYVRGLVDPTVGIGTALKDHFGDRLTFDLRNLYLDGLAMSGPLANVIKQRMLTGDPDWVRFAKFLVNLDRNPSKRASEAVWGWVEKHGVTITEDGRIVGYKGLVRGTDAVTGETDVPVSSHAGPNNFIDGVLYGETGVSYQVPHRLGTVVSKRRADVDDNNRLACSTGLHVGAYSYAKTFGENREDGMRYSTMGRLASTFALVTFDPADVVSVPEDGTADWKIRVTAYEISEFLDEVKDVLKDMPSYDVKTAAPFIPEEEKPFQQEEPAARYVAPVEETPAQDEKSEERKVREREINSLSTDQRYVYDQARMDGVEHADAMVYATDEEAPQPSYNLTLAENAALLPGLKADLENKSLGHKPLARKWAHLTTESSVRRYRKSNGIGVTGWTKVKDALS